MNITKQNVDALNAVVKIDIVAEDYQAKVNAELEARRKKATHPGFRKGEAPMDLIKKQHEIEIVTEEVNKVVQDSLNKFLTEEKLDLLGNPLPVVNKDFRWDAKEYSFEFELGLAPEFAVDLTPAKNVTKYSIFATDELLDKEIENIQTRFGSQLPVDAANEEANVTGTFVNEEKEINKKATLSVKEINGKANLEKFVGAKAGDVLELGTKGLFEDAHKLQEVLGVPHEGVHALDVNVSFTIDQVTKTEPAPLEKELFEKLFADGSVTTTAELKSKIKEDAELQFEQHADQQLLNAITEELVQNTKFDLPATFLQKWLQTAGGKELTIEQAAAEYSKSEKGLRYQLIEGKVMRDNDIKLEYAELVDYAKGFIRSQMAQMGNMNPEEKELNDIAGRVLQNQQEAHKLQSQLISHKLLAFYKEKMTFDTKEVSYEDFVQEVYK
ncbi:trigger factor [Tenacibaculum finnmarkense]|uniref:trigger factor n=1 Tax=Tenacibaculum finnmarkense TaxID=2781243 RepID=UPI00187B9E1D|nr:trigger factor [Tenacibaculum finnmarkense]MBE7688390.1 trigger factor [Tenacibaculum finnmarkense genomovar ulcerans]MCD8400453.1 trigger factor [Tenacibaculum finnmarkense genomovar ulcerans]MCD8422810.1 trigger factor [Tenacibaculum finnmarkense genomovar ulcerans]MCD8432862.1 trigger factor [Tenacibaculum finnmarkense genomovar ulcerans]MCD8443915.1 trigger factor [Tenacibaculum finnmarkense genomovar ulcerans]